MLSIKRYYAIHFEFREILKIYSKESNNKPIEKFKNSRNSELKISTNAWLWEKLTLIYFYSCYQLRGVMQFQLIVTTKVKGKHGIVSSLDVIYVDWSLIVRIITIYENYK